MNLLDFMDLIYRSIFKASVLFLHRINFLITQSLVNLVLAEAYFALLWSSNLFSGKSRFAYIISLGCLRKQDVYIVHG